MGIFGNNNNQTAPVVDQTTAVTNDQTVSIDGVLPTSATQDNSPMMPTAASPSTSVPVEDYIMTDPVAVQPVNTEAAEPAHISPAYNDMVGAPSPSVPEVAYQPEETDQQQGVDEAPSETTPEPEQPESPDSSPAVDMGYADLSTPDLSEQSETPETSDPTTPLMTEDVMPQIVTGRGGLSSGGDLDDIKQQALQQLTPLISHLNQSPEEKFSTTMMMLQATDDKSLVAAAYEAAQAITDEQIKAQALLAIVNEINYFANINK